MALADYDLVLPYAEWRELDWPGQIREATGLAKRILQMQERAVHAIAGLPEGSTTPEKLAWVTLWLRGFLLLQAAGDLRGEWSVRVADPLYRLAFELWLQVSAIRHPWARLNELRQNNSRSVSISEARLDQEWNRVADRLRAFAAWALTNVLVYFSYR